MGVRSSRQAAWERAGLCCIVTMETAEQIGGALNVLADLSAFCR
jgi:hypothetical protein